LAAQTSFYIILAFFPFVAFMLTLIHETQLDDTLFMQALSNFLPSSAYVLTLQILESAQAHKSLFISIGGVIASLWPFTRAVQSLIVSINTVYGTDEEHPQKAWLFHAPYHSLYTSYNNFNNTSSVRTLPGKNSFEYLDHLKRSSGYGITCVMIFRTVSAYHVHHSL